MEACCSSVLKRDHARPIRARPRHDEIVLLLLHRQESESGVAGDGIERHSPVGTALYHGGGHGIVISRLHGIAVRLDAAEQAIDQHARAAPLVAIDHHARGIVDGARDGLLRRPAFETRVSRAEDDALQAAVAGNELKRRSQERPIVFVGLRIEQVDARDIAFAALGGIQSGGAAHGEKLRAHALPLQFSQQVIESDAVAADHDQIGQLQFAAEKLDVDDRPGLNDLFMPADRGEAVGAAERGDAAGSLSHRIRRERRSLPVVGRLDQSDQQVLRPANLAIDLDGESGLARPFVPPSRGPPASESPAPRTRGR